MSSNLDDTQVDPSEDALEGEQSRVDPSEGDDESEASE
jgi:hypothetical protein